MTTTTLTILPDDPPAEDLVLAPDAPAVPATVTRRQPKKPKRLNYQPSDSVTDGWGKTYHFKAHRSKPAVGDVTVGGAMTIPPRVVPAPGPTQSLAPAPAAIRATRPAPPVPVKNAPAKTTPAKTAYRTVELSFGECPTCGKRYYLSDERRKEALAAGAKASKSDFGIYVVKCRKCEGRANGAAG